LIRTTPAGGETISAGRPCANQVEMEGRGDVGLPRESRTRHDCAGHGEHAEHAEQAEHAERPWRMRRPRGLLQLLPPTLWHSTASYNQGSVQK
jgi:hypothetical protein